MPKGLILCSLVLLLSAACDEAPTDPVVDASDAVSVRWVTPTGDISPSARVTAYGLWSGGVREMSLSRFLQLGSLLEAEAKAQFDSVVQASGGFDAIEGELDPSDPYFTTQPLYLLSASVVTWDGGNEEFDFVVSQEGRCIPSGSIPGERLPFRQVMLFSRCVSATDQGAWTHSAVSNPKVVVNGVVVSSTSPIRSDGTANSLSKMLPSLSVQGSLAGTCFTATMVSSHSAKLLYDGVESTAIPATSHGADAGCLPLPVECGGPLDELRGSPVRARPSRASLTKLRRSASVEDEVVYANPNCSPGGGGTAPGYWRCFTTITYWVETGIILRTDRWCIYEHGSSLREQASSDASSDAAEVAAARALRLIVRPDIGDSSVQIVFRGDQLGPDEIVLGAGATDVATLANALAVYERLAASEHMAELQAGVEARLPLSAYPVFAAIPQATTEAATMLLGQAAVASPTEHPRYGWVRRVDVGPLSR